MRKLIFVIFCGLLVLTSCDGPDETYKGVWISPDGKKLRLFLHSHYYRGGKSSTEYDYLRMIDMNSGKIIGETEYNTRRREMRLQFSTPHSLFVTYDKQWECMKLKDLSLRWDGEGLDEMLHKINPRIKKIHEINYWLDTFKVTNTAGEIFKFHYGQLENVKGVDSTYAIPVSEYYTIGRMGLYRNPNSDSLIRARLGEKISMWDNNLAFSRNNDYLMLDGEMRKQLKKFDTASHQWKNILNDKIWLKGVFVRPFSDNRDYAGNRNITTLGDTIFIIHHSSLDEEENKVKLSAVVMNQGKVLWSCNLEKYEMENDYWPKETLALPGKLITLWMNSMYNYKITCINTKTGKLKWFFKQ